MAGPLTTRRQPPTRKAGDGKGMLRTLNGRAMDLRSAAAFLGGSEKHLRGLVGRRMIPFKKLGGRIIFLRHELEAWLQSLEGCDLAEAQQNVEHRQARR